jgi:hypothetical protein
MLTALSPHRFVSSRINRALQLPDLPILHRALFIYIISNSTKTNIITGDQLVEQNEGRRSKGRYVYVKDRRGVEYICRAEDLKKPDELTEEEKKACMQPQGDA